MTIREKIERKIFIVPALKDSPSKIEITKEEFIELEQELKKSNLTINNNIYPGSACQIIIL